MEVRVENADGGGRIDRESITTSRLADRLGAGSEVHAERLPAVLAHIGVEPGDLVAVPLDDLSAASAVADADLPRSDKAAFNDVPRHHPERVSHAVSRRGSKPALRMRALSAGACARADFAGSVAASRRRWASRSKSRLRSRANMRYVSSIAPPSIALALEGRATTPEGHGESCLSWKRRLPIFGDEPQPACLRSRLAAGACIELAQDRRHVMVDRSAREKEPFRDLGVLKPLRHEREYVDLARGQVGRVSSGRRTR